MQSGEIYKFKLFVFLTHYKRWKPSNVMMLPQKNASMYQKRWFNSRKILYLITKIGLCHCSNWEMWSCSKRRVCHSSTRGLWGCTERSLRDQMSRHLLVQGLQWMKHQTFCCYCWLSFKYLHCQYNQNICFKSHTNIELFLYSFELVDTIFKFGHAFTTIKIIKPKQITKNVVSYNSDYVFDGFKI